MFEKIEFKEWNRACLFEKSRLKDESEDNYQRRRYNMAKKGGVRSRVQKFGSNLSSMVIPNLGAFIAWGILTAIAIPTDIELFTNFVSPMLTYLLPLLIAFAGGRMLHGFRGGVVGATAAMGVIVAADIPMFIGAMIMGPLGGWLIKKFDERVGGKIPAGFELLVNNFSAGIIGATLALIGSLGVGPFVVGLTTFLEAGVSLMISWGVLPLVSLFIEPAKILFLNNAISQGILAPIASGQVAEHGKSILFLLEANPGPGFGILLAYMVFGKGASKASAYGAGVIHFVGGIHEIYFPYVLMKPLLLIAAILGGMTGIFTLVQFDAGLVSIASPGSIIPIMLLTASDSYLGTILSVLLATIVSFVVASVILKFDKKEEGDLMEASKKMEATKGKKSRATAALEKEIRKGEEGASFPNPETIQHIIFACDAGLGSSAMGATMVRNKLKDAGIQSISVTNIAISNLPTDAQIIFTHKDLTERAREKQPDAYYVSVDNFLNSPEYARVVDTIRVHTNKSSEQETTPNDVSSTSSHLTAESIVIGGKATSKHEAIAEAADILITRGYVHKSYKVKMFEREESVSTFMGNGLAIPHGTDKAKDDVIQSGISIITYEQPISWDGNDVNLVIGIAGKGDEHLTLISSIATVCVDEENVKQIVKSETPEEVMSYFSTESF